MTDGDVLAVVPEKSFDLACELLDVIEAHNSFAAPRHRFPETLVADVVADPNYFVCEGGGNGTFGHETFEAIYEPLKPQLTLFAESLLE